MEAAAGRIGQRLLCEYLQVRPRPPGVNLTLHILLSYTGTVVSYTSKLLTSPLADCRAV